MTRRLDGESNRFRRLAYVGIFVVGLIAFWRTCDAASESTCLWAGNLAIGLDTLTTYQGLRNGAMESNPLIGKHPSIGRQLAVAGIKLAGNTYVCEHATDSQRTGWTVFVVGVEGGVGMLNLRYVFK